MNRSSTKRAPDDPGGVANPHDVVGVGFGPSNLALAIAARELDESLDCVFYERNAQVSWHPGMLIEGARMQISFLKDLVMLRNPASPYTFLQYAKAKNRLERFVNLGEFRPTRLEYQDYLRWVAEAFSGQVSYGCDVIAVAPANQGEDGEPSLLAVEVHDFSTGEVTTVFTRNVVYAAGGRPRSLPGECAGAIHSSRFLIDFPVRYADHAKRYEFGVAGDGQSAAEVATYLLGHYPAARVHLFVGGYALRATDNNPFVNEQFQEQNSDGFRDLGEESRAILRSELRNTNYGVVEEGSLDELYRMAYADEVTGARRLFLHPHSRLSGIHGERGALSATVTERLHGRESTRSFDGVVLATGYDRSLDPEVFGKLLPFLEHDEAGDVLLSGDYRAATTLDLAGGLYLQGYGESSFGLGDTLLSLLPFRTRRIVSDIRGRNRVPGRAGRPRSRPYPPRPYVDEDVERSHQVMRRFNFATVISARGADDPVVTHVPLTLDLTRGRHGVLFGHFDRSNPHAEVIDGREVRIVFHGPNAYMSPDVFERDVLPTWNSITVHVHGRGRLIADEVTLRRGLSGICVQSDPGPDAFRLDTEDRRIAGLIGHIVGFEIEIDRIVNRFKLSQELNEAERRRAADALADRVRQDELRLIDELAGIAPRNGSAKTHPHKGTSTARRPL
jgi:L-ornithine N5-oxygenase